jgi:hypothetical protein
MRGQACFNSGSCQYYTDCVGRRKTDDGVGGGKHRLEALLLHYCAPLVLQGECSTIALLGLCEILFVIVFMNLTN